jgi:hypothetical protein
MQVAPANGGQFAPAWAGQELGFIQIGTIHILFLRTG